MRIEYHWCELVVFILNLEEKLLLPNSNYECYEEKLSPRTNKKHDKLTINFKEKMHTNQHVICNEMQGIIVQ
jgi:hypothetical protein